MVGSVPPEERHAALADVKPLTLERMLMTNVPSPQVLAAPATDRTAAIARKRVLGH